MLLSNGESWCQEERGSPSEGPAGGRASRREQDATQTGSQVAAESDQTGGLMSCHGHIPGPKGSSPMQRGTNLLGFGPGEECQRIGALGRAPLLWGLPRTAPHYTLGTQTQ